MKKSLKWLLLIAGLGIIALGISTLTTPFANLITLVIFFGIAMLVSGVSEIASFISGRRRQRSGMMLTSGIITTLLGIWVIFGRGIYVLSILLPFIFAIWVMTTGITRIVDAISRRAGEPKIKVWELVFGIIASLGGFALLFNPLMAASLAGFTVSIMLIAYGVGSIEQFIRIMKAEKQTKEDPSEDDIIEEVI